MASSNEHRDYGCDLLRVFSIFYIVSFWHLCQYSKQLMFTKTDSTLLLTYCILGLFCFLSGFLISQRYLLRSTTECFQFLLMRMLRIYPLYFIALIGFLILGIVDSTEFLKAALLLNLALRQSLMTLWFVQLIIYYYILSCFILFKYSHIKTLCTTLILFCVLVLLFIKTQYVDVRIAQYLFPYIIGIMVAKSENLKTFYKNAKFVILCVISVLASFYFFSKNLNPFFAFIIVQTAVITIIPIFFYLKDIVGVIFNKKMLVFLSYSSFCMFLFHRIIFSLGISFYKHIQSVPLTFYLIFILTPLITIFSFCAQKCYDKVLFNIFRPTS